MSSMKTPSERSAGLAVLDRPDGPVAEAYRQLRTNLDFINFEHDIKTLLVTSAAPGEGKSTVAANLAVVLAQSRKQVVLMSGDFRRPAVGQFSGLDERVGLSEVLRGERSIREALQQPEDVPNLWVLPAGSMPPNPSELLGSLTMERLAEQARSLADWVIIDSPPLLAVADAAVAARWADGVLVVVQGGVSTKKDAVRAREMLETAGARIAGVVVWGLKVEETHYSYFSSYQVNDSF